MQTLNTQKDLGDYEISEVFFTTPTQGNPWVRQEPTCVFGSHETDSFPPGHDVKQLYPVLGQW
jgi:hypothetical protein